MSDLTVVERNTPPARGTPQQMFLGLMRPDRQDIGHLVGLLRQAVEDRARELGPEARLQLYQEYWPLELRDYQRYVRDFKQLAREFKNAGKISSVEDNAALRGFLSLGWHPDFTPDFEGWVAYLKALSPNLEDKIDGLGRPSALLEAGRREHTLIVAPVNWGKSELLKTLAYHYAEHRDLAAVVVLDPGGDMAKQMAQWPELVRDERAILIEPGLRKGKTVSLNPLDGEGLDEDERSIVAMFWAQQIGQQTSELTAPQERLARHCVHVLLAFPGGATFRDLILLLGAPKNRITNRRQQELLLFAQRYRNPRIAEFFTGDFESPLFETTRQALRGRIDWILSLPYAEAMFCGPADEPKFSLEQAIEDRKFILVNLAKFGQAGGAAIGKIFVAMLGAIARKRNTLPPDQRTPTHVFIDEVSTMVSPDLLKNLKELRKFGLYQTLAQQVEGDGFSKDYKQILTRLTACKFVGSPSGETGELLNTRDALPPLDHRQFYVQWPGVHDVGCLQVRGDLADGSHAVDSDAWRDYENRMIGRYYVDAAEFQGAPVVEFKSEAETLPATPAETRRKNSFEFSAEIPGADLAPKNPREIQSAENRPSQVPKPTAGPRKPRRPK